MPEAVCYLSPVCQSTKFSPCRSSPPTPWCSGPTSWARRARSSSCSPASAASCARWRSGARGGRPRYRRRSSRSREVRVDALRPAGRGAAPAGGVRAAALRLPRQRARPRRRALPVVLRRAARRLLPRRARPRTPSTAWRSRWCARREAGASPALLARYLEAWLLRLHGLYPPLDRCAGCGDAAARRALCATTAAAHGLRVRRLRARLGPRAARRGARAARARLPQAARGAGRRRPERPRSRSRRSTSDLIARHLERDLRSHARDPRRRRGERAR